MKIIETQKYYLYQNRTIYLERLEPYSHPLYKFIFSYQNSITKTFTEQINLLIDINKEYDKIKEIKPCRLNEIFYNISFSNNKWYGKR